MVVYIDILLILNFFVDYFLLLSASILSKIDISKKRILAGAFVGSLFSLLILLPKFGFFLILIVKIFCGTSLVLVTFGYKSGTIFIKTCLIFLAENLIFVGVMFCFWMAVSPPGMLWKNGITYISISPVVLVIGSLIAYFLTCLINYIISKRVDGKKIISMKVKFNEKFIYLKALHDTGNCLTEPFSGKPVCICEYESIVKILPKTMASFFFDFVRYSTSLEKSEFSKFVKLVPCNTVAGNLILPAFLPQSVSIISDRTEVIYSCYVAVVKDKLSDGEYSAIVGDFN